jgi:hypothetical protein
MYPFTHPADGRGTKHLERLYEKVQEWRADSDFGPLLGPFLTVINRQTQEKEPEAVPEFVREIVEPCSDVLEVWSADTCQMWLAGFGKRMDDTQGRDDVYWLIPGDFDYASPEGETVLENMEQLPRRLYSRVRRRQSSTFCLGEIETSPDNAKHLVDVYGTYGLLFNWFPNEAAGLRARGINRPRSEFFAIDHVLLDLALARRWYAYEQTLILLLHGVSGRDTRSIAQPIFLGKIQDDPQGRDTLASAMTQVERMERVLKNHWREEHKHEPGWETRYRELDARSEQIRGAALVTLGQVLSR